MEDEGTIRAFPVRIDRTKLDCSITGFIMVAPDPDKYASFCRFCEQSDAILEHHHVIGPYNAILFFAMQDTHALDALLNGIKSYGDSRTSVALKTYFELKDLPIPLETDA